MNRGIMLGMSMIFDVSEKMENWKKEILADYQKTFKMPRKMKKQRRKELNLDWSIANYDPFNLEQPS